MSIRDANKLAQNSILNTEVCIVGAGVAGITLSTELDGSSVSVCLIESGHYDPDEDNQALYGLEITGYRVRENFMSRARYFGGTSNLWAGRSMKLSELDFLVRDWVPNSGWPISYAEIEHYYDRAAKVLKLPSYEKFRAGVFDGRFSSVEKALFNNHELKPNFSLWARRPLRFGAAYKSQLRRSQNITVYLNANATELVPDPGGQSIYELKIVTLSGNIARIRAKRFVLACGGLENARLLLASRSIHASGVGNQYDLVGRFFMDHPRAVFGKVRFFRKQRIPSLLGIPLSDGIGQVGIQLSESFQQKEKLLNNYVSFERRWSPQTVKAYSSFIHSMKIVLKKGYSGKRLTMSRPKLATIPELIYLLSPRELMPHFLYRGFRAVKRRIDKGLTELVIINYCEQVPNPQSRVLLIQEKDRLNMPRLALDWKIGNEETRTVMRLQQLLDRHLRDNHIGYVDFDANHISELSYTDASHHIGTTRMGQNPHNSVVNENCKVHNVQNLFIAGSSVFPTCGYANPTWTIVALAIRLADHLKVVSPSKLIRSYANFP